VAQTTATGSGTVTVATTLGYDPDGNTVAQTAQTTDSAHPGQVQVATHAATYDAEDRQATETDNGLTTVYGYDAQGQQRVATVQDGQTAIATTLDAEGRVTNISEGAGNAGPYVSSFSYNTNDQLQTVALPGGVQESVQYDPNSQVVGVTALGPNTNGLFTSLTSHYGYTYDAAHRVNSTTTLSGTDALAYDGANRLTSETQQTGHQIIATGGAYGWTYDANGNLLTAIDDTGATDVYTYSTTIRDELTQMGATGDPVTKTNAYSYDGRGDVTGIANTAPANDKNALSQHLSYDSQGRINQVTYLDHANNNTTTTISIAYNAQGQRAEYAISPQGQSMVDMRFAYRDGELAQQQVVSNTAGVLVVLYTNTYLYGPNGEPLELIHAQPGQPTGRYWYETDSQGSVITLTDSHGNVMDRYTYDSWGESTSDDRTNEHVPQQLRYKAQYDDEKLTWYWLDGRYYDPETERYLQPTADTLGGGSRIYEYAADAPAYTSAATSQRPLCTVSAHFEPAREIYNPAGVYTGFIGYHGYLLLDDGKSYQRIYEGSSVNGYVGPNNDKGGTPHPRPLFANENRRDDQGNQTNVRYLKPDFIASQSKASQCILCSTYARKFDEIGQRILRQKVTYAFEGLGPNSNSFSYTVLLHTAAELHVPFNIPEAPFSVTLPALDYITQYPGWGIDLLPSSSMPPPYSITGAGM